MIIWTRVTTSLQRVDVPWMVAEDPAFKRVVARGTAATDSSRDFTVKVDVSGLKPGRDYYFIFSPPAALPRGEAGGPPSRVGHTRTLPVGPVKDVVLAACTCALYPNGYFNAYGAIAALPRVDAILHLGDYIYEYGGPGTYGMDSKVAHERPHDPPHDCVSLDDYRRRHAQYKTDPQLQAAHARAPWIVVWDDHETANDSWMHGAQNHHPETEGDWDLRKAAAIKAYYEWMPIREPAGGGFAINRSFDFGDLATVFMLETRLTARDRQLVYERDLPKNPTEADVAAFRQRLNDPARRMMSPAQEAWLGDGLKASVAAGRKWQVFGNEVVVAHMQVPLFRKAMGEAAYQQALAGLPPAAAKRMAGMEPIAALDLPYGLDMWDGYPADRERLYGLIRDARANAIVLSGDSHAFWGNELHDAAGRRVAVEFGATGVTSPGAGDTLTTIPVGEVFAKANRDVVFSDQASKGFVLLTLTPTEAKGELVKVSTIVEQAYTAAPLKAFTVTPGADGVSALTMA